MSKSKGTCAGCNVVLGRTAMQRHVGACEALTSIGASKARGLVERVRLTVDTPHPSPYWIIVDVHPDATLEELDGFLRELWLECCGHLSAFRVGRQSYAFDPIEDFDEQSLHVLITSALPAGKVVRYEYDFGSTTELQVRVGRAVMGSKTGDRIRLLAQNEAPVILCASCGKPAIVICAECLVEHNADGARCHGCRKRGHECRNDAWFDILNSPRLAKCGYGGNW